MGLGLTDQGSRWEGEVCRRCKRRNVVGFQVSDSDWAEVVGDRWELLCLTCFDEAAEGAMVRYCLLGTHPVTWSDWDQSETEGQG